MPGAVAAVAGARRARRPHPGKPDAVDEARLKVMAAEFDRVKKTIELFKKYDTDKSGKLDESQVKKLLTDLDSSTPPDTPPSDEELHFILKVADKAHGGDHLEMQELEYAMKAWGACTAKRTEMEQALAKYDKSHTGKLEKNELKEYLKELNGGKEVSDEEVDWVLSEADVFGDGACSKTELVIATSAWFSHVEHERRKSSKESSKEKAEKKKSSICAVL